MATRIEIELTSRRDDETFTWRAAGARQPKGVADASLFPEGSAVGEQFRVDADFDLEGITVVHVLPKEEKKPSPFDTLELIARDDEPLVTQQLAEKGRRGDRGDRGERRGGGRDKRRDSRERTGGDRERGPGGRERSGGDREGGDRRPRGGGDRPRTPAKPKLPPKPKPPRLKAGRTHRDALLASLPEEQKPVAQELLRGGLQAVRTALAKQNEQQRTEGAPEIDEGPILALAEDLLGKVRAAEWRDRAEAALEQAEVVDVRDLRTVVTAADGMGRDEETRALGSRLRAALSERLDAEHNGWVTEIIELLDDDRVVRALHLSSRPPKAGAPLPAPVAMRLVEMANASMTSDVTPDRWVYILEALAHSPVRRQVVPASLPGNVTPELKATIARFGSQLPEIAQIFGIEADPKAGRGAERRRRKPKPGGKPEGRPAGGGGGKPKGEQPKGEQPKDDQPTGEQPKDDAKAGGSQTEATEAGGSTTEASSDDPAADEATASQPVEPAAEVPSTEQAAADEPAAEPATTTDQPAADAITTSGPSATNPGGLGEAPEAAEPPVPAPTPEAASDEPPAKPEEAPLADGASEDGDGDAGDQVDPPAPDEPRDAAADTGSEPTSSGPETRGDAGDATTPPTADAIDRNEGAAEG